MTCRNVARCPAGPEGDRLSRGFGGLVRDGGEVPGVQRGAVTVVGGAGFVGSAIARRATGSGRPVVSVDRVRQPPPRLPATVEQRMVDLLVDPIETAARAGRARGRRQRPARRDPWRLVLDNAVTTARLLPALAGRQVVLVSSAEVHGPAGGELPVDDAALAGWCASLLDVARRPCPPWQVAGLCRELVAADPTGRWALRAVQTGAGAAGPPGGRARPADRAARGQPVRSGSGPRRRPADPAGAGRAAADRHRHRADLPAGRRPRRRRRSTPNRARSTPGWPRCR